MKARLFQVLLVVIAVTGILIAGVVAHAEASSAMSQGGVAHHDAASFSVPF